MPPPWTSYAGLTPPPCVLCCNAEYLYGWGNNSIYNLGLGDTTDRDVPTQVNSETDWFLVSASNEALFGMAIKMDGTLWGWGSNFFGNLGLGDNTDRHVPVLVSSDSWLSVSSCGEFTIALKSDGTLWSTGYNGQGELGQGDLTNRNTLTQIGTDTDWVFLGTAAHSTMAIKSDGTLWSWGANDFGQLGQGDSVDRNVPTKVGTDTDWAVAAGATSHCMAIKTTGTLWGVGANTAGQLGLGNTTSHNTFVQVGSDTDWLTVSCATGDATIFSFTIAVKTGGTLWGWGYNAYGQLGIGSVVTPQLSPVQAGVDTDWMLVSASANFSAGIKSTGTLWMWGQNGYGQLGQGDFTDRDSPTRVGTGSAWSVVSCGGANAIGFAMGIG